MRGLSAATFEVIGPDDLTPGWLTQALRGAGAIETARVTTSRATDIGSGAGVVGRIFRLDLDYESADAGAPKSVIAKFPALPGPTREIADRFRLYEREHGFYRKLAGAVDVPTPCCFHAEQTPGGPVLLLEDLAPAEPGDLVAGCSIEQAAEVLDVIASMHVRYWNNPVLDTLEWLPPPNDDAAIEVATSLSGRAWRDFREQFAAHLPPPIVTLGDRLSRDRSVLDRLGGPPRTLIHGDLRINNVFFSPGGGTLRAIIDWQTVLKGAGPIDVARLFVNNLHPADRRRAEQELLPVYHERLLEGGVRDYSLDDCWLDYRLAMINQFGQVVVLSSILDVNAEIGDEVGDVTGARLIVALQDLDLLSLIPPTSQERLVHEVKRVVRRVPGAVRTRAALRRILG